MVGKYLLQVIEESIKVGKMLLAFNTTFIALIPKVDSPTSFEYFLPISFCNGMYKVIEKVIACCLKPILSNTIYMEQFGFLEGRQIHEVIRVAQEGLQSIKN